MRGEGEYKTFNTVTVHKEKEKHNRAESNRMFNAKSYMEQYKGGRISI